MRIDSNDISVDIYETTSTISSEGYKVQSLVLVAALYPMDVQPVGTRINLAAYGLESVAANMKHCFYDEPIINLGHVLDIGESTKYIVKGVKNWYDHSEAIIEPIKGV